MSELQEVIEHLKEIKQNDVDYYNYDTKNNSVTERYASVLLKINASGFKLLSTQLNRQITLMGIFVKELTGVSKIFYDSYALESSMFNWQKKQAFDNINTSKSTTESPGNQSDFKTTSSSTSTWWDKIKAAIAALIGGVVITLGFAGKFLLKGLMKPFQMFGKLFASIGRLFSSIGSSGGGIASFIKNLVPNILNIGKSLLKKFFIAFAAFDFITTMFNPSKVKEITGSENANILEKIGAGFAGVIETLTFGMLGDSKQIYSFLKNDVFDLLVGLFKSIFMGIGGSTMVEEIKTSLFTSLKEMYINTVMSIADIFGLEASSVDKYLSGFFGTAFEIVKTSIVNIINLFVSYWENIKSIFDSDSLVSVGESIKNIMGVVYNLYAEPFKILWDYLKSFTTEGSMVNEIMTGAEIAFKGLKETIVTLINWITEKFDSMLSFLGFGSAKDKDIKKIENGASNQRVLKEAEASGKTKTKVEKGIFSDTETIDVLDIDKLTKEEAESLIASKKIDKTTRDALYDKFFLNDLKETQQENNRIKEELDKKNAKNAEEQKKRNAQWNDKNQPIIELPKSNPKEVPTGKSNPDAIAKAENEKQKITQTNITNNNTVNVAQSNTNVGETINMALDGYSKFANKYPSH